MTALAIIHKDAIIQQVSEGKRLADIARTLGLSGKGQAISNALANDPEYQAARINGLAARLDQREDEMESCSAQDVPRARELLSHARWRCEREAPKVWGAKQDAASTSVTIVIAPRDSDGVIIDQSSD